MTFTTPPTTFPAMITLSILLDLRQEQLPHVNSKVDDDDYFFYV